MTEGALSVSLVEVKADLLLLRHLKALENILKVYSMLGRTPPGAHEIEIE